MKMDKEIATVTTAVPVGFAFLQMIIHGLLLDHIAIGTDSFCVIVCHSCLHCGDLFTRV